MISQVLSEVVSFVWGLPLLIFLALANLILLYHSRLIPLKGFIHSLKLIGGKVIHHSEGEGQISHFQALSNALAATIGLGNIAGVAVAIYQGGAGAIFWMWIAAFLGMNTKFFECTLAVMYRGKDYLGEVQGGPMYYIEQALPSRAKFLALFFSVCGLIGTLSLFQINQLSNYLRVSFDVSPYVTGIVLAIVIAYILIGGLRRISQITSKLVPLMGIIYILLCVVVLWINRNIIPDLFLSIFTEALTGKSISGGVLGYGVLHIMKTGLKRAAFSNEAGIGTAPMAHGNAKTSEPISEGYVAMLGPFFDTIIVCTMTALVILTVRYDQVPDLNGISLTSYAFTKSLGEIGNSVLAIVIFLFSFTTMIGMANYNRKCWDYIFKGKRGFRSHGFIAYYCMTIMVGAVIAMNDVVNLIDIAYALMTIPNIIATIYLAGRVNTALKKYNKTYKV
jgi:AGCS family alanine or glycine:cation symporter